MNQRTETLSTKRLTIAPLSNSTKKVHMSKFHQLLLQSEKRPSQFIKKRLKTRMKRITKSKLKPNITLKIQMI